MYRDDPLPDCSDDTSDLGCWLTTLGDLVWYVTRFADDDVDSLRILESFFIEFWFFFDSIFVIYLAFS